MIHLHNTLSSALDRPPAATSKQPATHSALESFHSSLSDAVSSTLTKYGIDPEHVQVSIAPAKDPVPPSTPTTPPASTTPTRALYNPFAQPATQSWTGI